MNRTRKLSRSFLLLVIAAAATLQMRAGSGGSSYSIFGVGDIRYTTGLRSVGMGYTGLAFPVASSINGLSPASWSYIDRVRLEVSLLYEGFTSTDGTRSRYLARADFSGAILALPISRDHGITLTGGFLPFSTVNYDAYTTGNFVSEQDTFSYALHHVGSGGISRGLIGLSWSPTAYLSVGFSTNVLFGTAEKAETQIPTSREYIGGELTDRVTANGVVYTLGAVYTGLGRIIPVLGAFSVGGMVTTGTTLNVTNITTYRFGNRETSTERDTSVELANTTTMPFSFGVGVGLRVSERVLCAVDYAAQPWAGALVNGEPQISLRNSQRIGVGFERLPSYEPYASLLGRTALRLGAYYNQTYYEPNGQPIDERGVTAGFGFPFSGDSRLDLAFEYAERGTTENGLVKDKIFRLSAGLSIGALWFVQYPED